MMVFMLTMHDQSTSTPSLNKRSYRGQSLVEFVMIVPVIILLMVIAAYVGMAMYHGNMASSAVKGPSMHKLEMADNPAAVGEGDLMGFAMASAPTGNINEGGVLDALTLSNVSPLTSVMVGEKIFTAPLLFANVDFVFSASESIQLQLLETANQGGVIRVEDEGIRLVEVKPIEHPDYVDIPNRLQFNEPSSCALVDHGPAIANSIFPNAPGGGSTYISTLPPDGNSPFTYAATLSMRHMVEDLCPLGAEQGTCEAEFANFSDHDITLEIVTGTAAGTMTGERTINNPPGGPGFSMKETVTCTGDDCLNAGAILGDEEGGNFEMTRLGWYTYPAGPHGDYHDPSGSYTDPPASFVDNCNSRKQAECIAIELGILARRVAWDGTYRFECDAN